MGDTVIVIGIPFSVTGFCKSTPYESIFGIHESGFTVLPCIGQYFFLCPVSCLEDVPSFVSGGKHFLHLGIMLDKFDGQVTCGESVTQLCIPLYFHFHRVDTLLHILSVVDVDMAEIVFSGFTHGGKVLLVFFLHIIGIVFMPLFYMLGHLGIDVAVFVEEVDTLIHIDDDMEEQFQSLSCLERSGHHRCTKQLAQFVDIQMVSPLLKLIIHIERAHHAKIHVDELGGEVKIPFQVGRVNHIDYDIRRLVDDVLSHIQFLRTVSRKRIGAGKVYQIELIAFERSLCLRGIDGHPAVVAHLGMRS